MIKRYKYYLIPLGLLLTIGLILVGYALYNKDQALAQNSPTESTSHNGSSASLVAEEAVAPEEVTSFELPLSLAGLPAREQEQAWQGQPDELVLRSVGDVLIHDRVSWLADVDSPVYQASLNELVEEGLLNEAGDLLGGEAIDFSLNSEQYDFLPMLARIAPYTSYADVTVANLEVIAAYPELPVTGYPQFNAPASILEALKQVGVDIVSNGTNHTLDWFSEGARASIANLKAADLMYTGSYENVEDFQMPRIVEANGISLGFLTYSYGTNGIPVTEGEDYLISLVDLPTMLSEIEWLKPQVDAVVVTLQLGPEYGLYPDDNQLYVFQALADAGVKLILGGHPHVLQPVEWLNDGQTFAIYSQASFLSGQRELDNKQGGITEVTFKRDEAGEVYVTQPKFMPIFMLGVEGEKQYQTVPMADYDLMSIPEGEYWFATLKDHMASITDDFDFVSHLATEWTLEASDLHR